MKPAAELIEEISTSLKPNNCGTSFTDYDGLWICVMYYQMWNKKNDDDILNILITEFNGCELGSDEYKNVCDKYTKLTEEAIALHEAQKDFNNG